MNKADLQAELDARKIEYNKESTNQELIALLETADANNGTPDEQNEIEKSGADGAVVPTPTPAEKTETRLLAEKLMTSEGVKEIYRTKDGYWFTKHDLAVENIKKCGGEIETFKAE